MGEGTIPNPPDETKPDADWEHYELYASVKKALYSLPSRFESRLNIDGVLATDLFAFNSSLGATIEQQVVDSLNPSLWVRVMRQSTEIGIGHISAAALLIGMSIYPP